MKTALESPFARLSSVLVLLFIFGCEDPPTVRSQPVSIRGNWDLRISFPGSGTYDGVSNTPSASQLCSSSTGGQSVNGVNGSAVCQSGTASFPASRADVIAGKEYWDSTGAKQTGSFQGNLDITFYSMAPRSDTATVLPSLSNTRNVASMAQESVHAQAFLDQHQLVPNPLYNTDGTYGLNGVLNPYHLATIVGGRPSIACGTSGVIEARIADCSNLNGVKAFYDGKKFGQSGEGDWKLVTRTANGYEVWRDERTKLLWSDVLSATYNWYRAAGYASNDTNVANTGGYNATPGSGVQPNPPVSVCVDAALIPTLSGSDPFTSPAVEDQRKGNLNYAGNPSVIWRLPTIEDWKLAEVNGIRKVLKDVEGWFWSATSSFHRHAPWMINTIDGGIQYWTGRDNSTQIRTRCIGHAVPQ